MHAFSIRKMRNTCEYTYVVHEEDLVIAGLSVLGVDGHDELMASLDGNLKVVDCVRTQSITIWQVLTSVLFFIIPVRISGPFCDDLR